MSQWAACEAGRALSDHEVLDVSKTDPSVIFGSSEKETQTQGKQNTHCALSDLVWRTEFNLSRLTRSLSLANAILAPDPLLFLLQLKGF